MGTNVILSVCLVTIFGYSTAQQFLSQGQGQDVFGSFSSFPIQSRLSSGSSQRGAGSIWSGITSPDSRTIRLQSGSQFPQSFTSQGSRLTLSGGTILGTGSLQQIPRQTSFSQQRLQTIQQTQPLEVRSIQSSQIPVTRQVVASQQGQLQQAPRHVISTQQQGQIISAPQQIQTAPQQVAQPVQTVQHVQPAVQPAVHQPVASNPMMSGMGPMSGMSPMGGMGPMSGMSPMGGMHGMGMVPGMNPMASMMGMPMGMGMGMGMPFMSYDTMEDLFLDPDRPSHMGPPMGPPMGVPMGPGVAMGATAAGASAVVGSSPAGGAVASSAASVGLGHLSAPATSTGTVQQAQVAQTAGHAQVSGTTGQVSPAVVQSALQTALSRVQQRQG